MIYFFNNNPTLEAKITSLLQKIYAMPNIKIIITVFLIFCSLQVSYNQTTWQRIYPHNFGTSTGHDVQPTSDGGFIFVGEIDFPTGAIRHYIRLIKVNVNGDVQWEKIYKENEVLYEAGYSVRVNEAGEYIIGGTSDSDIYLMRVAANGDTLMTRKYGEQAIDRCEVVRILPNGDYLLGGGSVGIDTDSPFVMRVSPDGDMLWQTWLGIAPLGGIGVTDLEIEDENHFVAISNDGITRLTGLNSNGLETWNTGYQFTKFDMMTSFTRTGEQKYVMSGIGSGFAGYSPLIASVYADGSQEWGYGAEPNSHIMNSVESLPGGDLITGINEWSGFPPSGHVYINKYNASGNLLWSKSYMGDATPFSVYPLSDGGFIACGSLNGQMMLIRTDANGEVNTTGAETPSPGRFLVYPNPVKQMLNLEMPGTSPDVKMLQLMTMDGRVLSEMVTGADSCQIEMGNYPPGVYRLRIRTGEKVSYISIVKE
jgi:hypothetical protein